MIELFPPREIALALALPAALSALVLLAARRLDRASSATGSRPWAPPLALGLGYLVGHSAILGRPPLPPAESTQWLAVLAFSAMVVGLIDGLWRAPGWARWGARVALSLFALGVFVRPLFQLGGDDRPDLSVLAGLEIGLLVVWRGAEALADRLRGPTMPLTLAVVAAGTTGVLLLSFSLVQGKLGAALTATLAGCLVGSLWDRDVSLARGGIGVAVVLVAGLLLDGYFYSQVPAASALLLGLAPLGPWIGRIAPVRRLGRWPATLVGTVGVLLPVGLALAIALRQWLERGADEMF